jgi:hypothetical protein
MVYTTFLVEASWYEWKKSSTRVKKNCIHKWEKAKPSHVLSILPEYLGPPSCYFKNRVLKRLAHAYMHVYAHTHADTLARTRTHALLFPGCPEFLTAAAAATQHLRQPTYVWASLLLAPVGCMLRFVCVCHNCTTLLWLAVFDHHSRRSCTADGFDTSTV